MQTGDAGRINFGNPYPIDLKSKRSEAPPDRTIPVEIFQQDPGNADNQGLLHRKTLMVGNFNVRDLFKKDEPKPAEPQAAPSQDLPTPSQTKDSGNLHTKLLILDGNIHDWMVADHNIGRNKPESEIPLTTPNIQSAYYVPGQDSLLFWQTSDVKGSAAAGEIANHEIGHQFLESLGKPSDHLPIEIRFELKDPKPLRASEE